LHRGDCDQRRHGRYKNRPTHLHSPWFRGKTKAGMCGSFLARSFPAFSDFRSAIASG
jgi:hypothetical protein